MIHAMLRQQYVLDIIIVAALLGSMLLLAKHRNGPLGVVLLRFDNRTTTFQNLARYAVAEGY